MSDFDDFDQNDNNGIFGADMGGLEPNVMRNIERVRSTVSKDGYVIEFACPGCRRKMTISVEYPELISISLGLAPHLAGSGSAWNYDQGHSAFYPNATCGQCGAPLHIMLPVAEAQGALQKAVATGNLPQQTYQQIAGKVNQIKQRYG